MINVFEFVKKVVGKAVAAASPQSKQPLSDEERARLIALLAADPAAAKQLLADARVVAQATQPAAGVPGDVPGSQWQTAPPRADPWYRDDRRGASRGGSWIPQRPNWLQPGNGRRGATTVATIIGPDGGVRPMPTPDYEPHPFMPPER